MYFLRKLPNLRFCVTKYNGEYWFKLIKNFEMDFQVSHDDPVQVSHQLNKGAYDMMNGPLWRVRVVQTSTEGTVFCFAFHHVIGDGITGTVVCKTLIKILDEMLSLKEINPSIGKEEVVFADRVHKQVLSMTDYVVLLFLAIIYIWSCFHFQCNMKKQPCKKEENKNVYLHYEFSEEESKQMFKMCKAKQVTVNSFIASFINFTFLKHNESKNKKKFLWSIHAIILRKDLDDAMEEQPGCIVSFLNDTCYLTLQDNFWQSTLEFHKRFKKDANVNQYHWKVMPWIVAFCNPNNVIQGPRDADYILTNLGRIDTLVQEPNSTIRVKHMIRSTHNNISPTPAFSIGCHSLGNKFNIYCDFPTHRINEQEGRHVFNNICQDLKTFLTQEYQLCNQK